MRLLLLRHGRTSWNDEGRFQGHADPDLDDTGRGQAAAVAPAVRALRPAVVVSSDLRRCRDTALALGLPFRLDARLREIDIGAWSGLTQEEAAARHPEENAAWRRGEDVRRGGGETYEEVAARAALVLDDLLLEGLSGPDDLIVFVLHGGTARSLIGRLVGLPPELWWRLGPLANCRWSAVRRVENGAYRLAEHNSGPLSAPVPTPASAPAYERDGAIDDQAVGPPGGTDVPTQAVPTGPGPEPVCSPSVT